jgi:methylmalonyl-CoA/ethylmalonyl-CoA epimerase
MADVPASPKAMFSDLVQIGVVVRDLDRVRQVLSAVFGLGPFRTITYPPPGRASLETFYHGQPGDFVYRLAFTELGPVELELIQPLEGDSVWKDFLEQHGEGIHHIRFNVPDVEAVIEYLKKQGIGVAQRGAGLRPGTNFAVLDTEGKVGFAIEIFNPMPGTDGRTPQFVEGRVVE